MNQLARLFISTLPLLSVVILFSSCQQEDDIQPNDDLSLNELKWEPKTQYFAQFYQSFFNQNPLSTTSAQILNQQENFWEDRQPFSIQSAGSGYICDLGPDDPTSFLAFSVIASESIPENTQPPYYKSKLEISVPFAPRAFETQESFYGLLKEGTYEFADSFLDFGSFIINYQIGDKLYSSQNVDNESFKIRVSNLIKVSPKFNEVPAGNNGLPASVDATFTFSCLLKSSDNDFLLIKNAVVRGKYYRQTLPDLYWEDWGKGWNANR